MHVSEVTRESDSTVSSSCLKGTALISRTYTADSPRPQEVSKAVYTCQCVRLARVCASKDMCRIVISDTWL